MAIVRVGAYRVGTVEEELCVVSFVVKLFCTMGNVLHFPFSTSLTLIYVSLLISDPGRMDDIYYWDSLSVNSITSQGTFYNFIILFLRFGTNLSQ